MCAGYVVGISIFINADGNLGLFENGLRQNVVFLYQLYCAAPGCARVYLINGGDGELVEAVERYGLNPGDVVRLQAVEEELDVLIVMGAALDPNALRAVRDRGCRIIAYKGGNGAVISMEAVVAKGARSDGERYFDADLYDEIWLTPQHWRTYRGWCETIYRCHVRQIPHIWAPTVVQAVAGDGFGYRRGARPWRVGVMDPNITVMKTSHMPMLVCEEAFRRKADGFAAFYIANGLRHANDAHFVSFAQSLSATQAAVMTFEPRFVGALFMRDHCDAIVTHHWENALNYLYWEALHGGYPLIHNSAFLNGAGYLYGDFDAEDGANALLRAKERHDDDFGAYCARANEILASLNPLSPANIATYEAALAGDSASPAHAISP